VGVGGGEGTGDRGGFEQKRRRAAAALTAETLAAVEAARELARTWAEASDVVRTLSLDVASTVPGVVDMGIEAAHFAQAMASGLVPTADLNRYFLALAQEHGPDFVKALEAAVEQLGLSREEAQAILDSIAAMAQGVEVPVNYVISVSGSPPPGAGGPAIPFEGKLHGGWIGVPGFAPGGWVTSGSPGRDSVPAMLARKEFVVQAPAAGWAPDFLEAYNRNPRAALGRVVADATGPVPHYDLVATIVVNVPGGQYRETVRVPVRLVPRGTGAY
jgi:hypothetical protein